ncbi:MAG: DUF3426 domain-containing protein [Methylococcaceae bacterium]|nr:DUF3426 domain-containing protein [Methylococcaceae bacterium]
MYTQCPSCKTTYLITIRQLRNGRGEALCQECQVAFNVLATLSENVRDAIVGDSRQPALPVLGNAESVPSIPYERNIERLPPEHLPGITAPARNPVKRYVDWPSDEEPPEIPTWSWASALAWGSGIVMLAGMLLVQLLIFEGDRLLQNAQLRPFLDLACDTLHCSLPEFRASQDIRIVSRSLKPAADDGDGLEFNLVIANHSSLAQAFPRIKLALTDHGGRLIQSRIFTPSDYLPGADQHIMPVGKPFEIKLVLVKPHQNVHGFEFDLL